MGGVRVPTYRNRVVIFNPSLRKRKDITKSYQGGGGQGQLDDRGVGVEGNHQNDYDSNLLEKDHL